MPGIKLNTNSSTSWHKGPHVPALFLFFSSLLFVLPSLLLLLSLLTIVVVRARDDVRLRVVQRDSKLRPTNKSKLHCAHLTPHDGLVDAETLHLRTQPAMSFMEPGFQQTR